ncbi:hypothetical protein Sjap_012191 [Stephania japonica]|uniref:Uncharacterized protein n=1 Tax=Stephania japonica TaxID=461633 RepID=A0AAP0NY16_9MAGN
MENEISSISIPPHVLKFLNNHFKTREDLSKASSISIELKRSRADTDRNLTTLHRNLSHLFDQWVSRSNALEPTFNRLDFKFHDMDSKGMRRILGEELPMLAKEVRRIETVRAYAETALRLEALVGDLEDEVFSVLGRNVANVFTLNATKDFLWKQDKLLRAVKIINSIEDIVAFIIKSKSQWFRLLKSVDARVDKSLVSLRLQAISDHRALLTSLGWPPPLTSEPDRDKGSELPNPLVVMHGDKRDRYSRSFLSLCALQHLQTRREERRLGLVRNKDCYKLGLWAIDELVSPIASRVERHFLRWFDRPKFTFALVYKITKDFAPGIDDVLQPMIDEARLVGYSAKEAWVSSMVKMLSTFLAKRMFPVLYERYQEKKQKREAGNSWLHLIDLIIAFDKQMQTLASMGTTIFVRESLESGGTLRDLSVLSIFCDRLEWLKHWAKIELKDALEKLKLELENKSPGQSIAKPTPVIAEAVIKTMQSMMDRCQTLPVNLLRVEFIRLSACRFLWNFFNIMLQRCAETEFGAGHAEDNAIMQVCASINAARYCESVIREWNEDINYLEMRIVELDSNAGMEKDLDGNCYFFWDEIKFLMKFETDWLGEIMSDLLRQFDMQSRVYIQNKEQWGWWDLEDSALNAVIGDDNLTITSEFVEALDSLRDRLRMLEGYLNLTDFLDLWRSVAEGLDHFIFSSIVIKAPCFSEIGIAQFSVDMRALFLVFHPFCSRPEAFFPCIRNSLKLLEMNSEDVKHLQSLLSQGGHILEHLRRYGIVYISPNEAEKIVKSRNFTV